MIVHMFTERRCRICGEMFSFFSSGKAVLCSRCESGIESVRIQGALCGRCGVPLVSEQKLCMKCRESDSDLDSGRSLFFYRDPVKRLYSLYKFGGDKLTGSWFAERIEEVLREEYPSDAIIVPVPGNPDSVKKRGWDQMIPIVRLLRRKYGYSCERLLKRKKSVQQKKLSGDQRKSNMQGKIAVRRGRSVSGKYLLLDDIRTTGATLNECAAVLKKSGAGSVCGITIAID